MAPSYMEAVEEYDPALLEDHPLRSYPRECCPGLRAYWKGSDRDPVGRDVRRLPLRILWVFLVAW